MTGFGANKAAVSVMSALSADQDLTWRKSSWSSYNGSCVEVAAPRHDFVCVRDTKQHGAGPVLAFTQAEWQAFLTKIKTGKLGF